MSPATSDKLPPKRRNRAVEIAAGLAPVAAAIGLPPSEHNLSAPQIPMGGTISSLSREVGMHLATADIFLQGGAIVTVNPVTGAVRVMEAIRFCSWVERFVSFVQSTKDGVRPVSISAEMAAKILNSDEFREALRLLLSVVTVRLPTWANKEKSLLRLLPSGYDAVTQTFTVDLHPYCEDLDVNLAWDFFLDFYADFPFAEPGILSGRGSLATQMGAHFALFCRNLLADCARPAFVNLANQSGSGKSILVKAVLAPIYGMASIQAVPSKEEELGKLLTASAAEGAPYLFFDNVRGRLSSSELESFITSPIRTGRERGKSGTITAKNLAQIFITGNGLTLSPDLARRSCVMELFCSGEAADRKFPKLITDEWLVRPETRQKFLSALWSGLRFWQEQKGCQRTEGLVLHGFEEFSQIIGGIVMSMGFADPMARPEVSLDEAGDAWKRLLAALAATVPDGGSVRFTPGDCLEKAEELDVLDLIAGAARDPKKALGHKLKKFRGREFIDGRGRRFEFGQRLRDNTSSGYLLRILTGESPPV